MNNYREQAEELFTRRREFAAKVKEARMLLYQTREISCEETTIPYPR